MTTPLPSALPSVPLHQAHRCFWKEDADFPTVGQTFELHQPTTLHHLVTVRRLVAGEGLVVVDALGQQPPVLATVHSTGGKRIEGLVVEALPAVAPAWLQVTLACALLKEGAWDTLLQQGTQLGACQWQPLMTQRCVVQLKGEEAHLKKQERWQHIVEAAALQSEAPYLPAVLPPCSLEELLGPMALNPPPPNTYAALVEPRQSEPLPLLQDWVTLLKGQAQAHQSPLPLTLLVGPEGGWHPSELAAMQAVGVVLCQLSPRILRAETAAVAAMALCQ